MVSPIWQVVASAFALGQPGSAATATPINLACIGGGVDRRRAPSNATVFGSGGPVNVVGTREVAEGYEDQVRVELNGDTGRIRVPRSLLPPIRDGGDSEGFWRLRDLRYRGDEITGRVRFNFLFGAEVRIDRLSGQISIRGRGGTFSGFCEAYDPATVQRRF